MDFNKVLNQVLDVAKQTAQETMKGNAASDNIAKIGGGAAALGVLSMLLGRGGGSNLAKLGSLTALGSLAYKAYQNYQQQAQTGTNVAEADFSAATEQDEQNTNRLVLQAMIAAAASDGHVTEEEKQAILDEAGDDAEVRQWLEQAIASPLSAEQIAGQVGGNQALAAQIYLAARMVCAELTRKEIIFLADLAKALRLEEAFVEQLEKQAGF